MTERPQLPESLSPVQYYALIRSQIEHEDNLVGQRLSWFVAAQAFLFTAYAITVSNIHPDSHGLAPRLQQSMLTLVPLVAVLTCRRTMTRARKIGDARDGANFLVKVAYYFVRQAE